MSLVVSDHSQIVSFSCFYLFSKAIGALELHSFCIDFRISICYTGHFWAIFPLFVFFFFLILKFTVLCREKFTHD